MTTETTSPAVERSQLKLKIDQMIREKRKQIKILEQDIEILGYGLNNLVTMDLADWKKGFNGTEVFRIMKEVDNG